MPPHDAENDRPKEAVIELPVHGMTCRGCARNVETKLEALAGVEAVDVDLAGNRASVRCGPDVPGRDALVCAVESLGFRTADRRVNNEVGTDRRARKRLLLIIAVVLAVIAAGTYAFTQVQSLYFSGILQDLNGFFGQVSPLAVGLAFVFGLLVAFAPASYAMAPTVMGYVLGAEHLSGREAFKLSTAFVSGIVTVDLAVGALFAAGGATAISFFSARLPLWYALITVILLALALIMLKVWKLDLPLLKLRWGRHSHSARSARGAYLLGVPFGLIACPACTPLLLPVALGAAATGQVWYGAALMGAFALGRGLPLVALGTSAGAFRTLKGATSYVPWIEKAVGVLLLAGALYFLREFFRVSGAFGLL